MTLCHGIIITIAKLGRNEPFFGHDPGIVALRTNLPIDLSVDRHELRPALIGQMKALRAKCHTVNDTVGGVLKAKACRSHWRDGRSVECDTINLVSKKLRETDKRCIGAHAKNRD